MKHLLLSLLIFGFGISGSLGQTIKSLGYNTTNGQVVANTGTNVLTFPIIINAEELANSGDVAIQLANRELIAGGQAVFNWGSNYVEFGQPITFAGTNAAPASRTNLGLGGTNNVVFNSLHAEQDANSSVYSLTIGQTNTGFRGTGGGENDFVFTRNGTNLLGFTSGSLQSFVGHSFSAPLVLNYGAGSTSVISFGGIDAATGVAISRTNLGLGGGITATNTFVSYNGTNYTTNTVTISNGIITGWTQ